MAIVTGVLGNVAWSGGNPQSAMAAAVNFQDFSLCWNTETFDEPILNTSVPNTLRGLGDWNGTLNALWETKPIGSTGLVTWANGYAANVEEWSLTISVDEFPVPTFNATAPTSKNYVIGRYRASVDISAYLDSSTQIVTLPNTNDPSAITLRYDDNTADGQYDGSVVINSENVTVDPRNPNRVRISADLDGALSSTGTATILPAGQFSAGDFRELVLTQTTSRTFTGSAALVSFTHTCNVAQPMRISAGFRGTGDLTTG